MRKVVIDAFDFVGLRGGAGGAGSYFLSLIEQLARLVDVSVIASATNGHLFVPMTERAKRLVVATEGDTHAEAIHASMDGADVLYAPFTSLPERTTYCHIPAVTAIHDLQHRYLKSFFPEPERIERDNAYFEAVTDADAILTFAQVESQNIKNLFHAQT